MELSCLVVWKLDRYGTLIASLCLTNSLQRVNSSFYLDAVNNSWAVLPCKGDLPSPRCFHGACAFDDLMIVHGGEGPINFKETVPNPLQDDSLSTAADLATEKPKYRSSAALAGICPGDNIQGSKFGPNAIKVNSHECLHSII